MNDREAKVAVMQAWPNVEYRKVAAHRHFASDERWSEVRENDETGPNFSFNEYRVMIGARKPYRLWAHADSIAYPQKLVREGLSHIGDDYQFTVYCAREAPSEHFRVIGEISKGHYPPP